MFVFPNDTQLTEELESIVATKLKAIKKKRSRSGVSSTDAESWVKAKQGKQVKQAKQTKGGDDGTERLVSTSKDKQQQQQQERQEQQQPRQTKKKDRDRSQDGGESEAKLKKRKKGSSAKDKDGKRCGDLLMVFWNPGPEQGTGQGTDPQFC